MTEDCALRLTGISKRYPGVQALNAVSFECLKGEIHAVVGENGSGKSTLMGVASGAINPDEGTVKILGATMNSAHPAVSRRMGVATVYQNNSLIPQLSVEQNLLLAAPPGDRPRYSALTAWARTVLAEYDLLIDPRARVAGLSLANQQFLELVKALLSRPKVLLLDEPTTALGPAEVERLHAICRKQAASGTAVVYISHRLPEVLSLCSRVTVLRDGEHQGCFSSSDLSTDDVVALMVGNPIELEFPAKRPVSERDEEVALSARQLSGDAFGPIDLTVHKGEILGIAGAEGNGQPELLRALAGVLAASGSIQIGDNNLRTGSVRSAVSAGVILLSGDRAVESIFPTLGVRENMTVQVLRRFATAGVIAGKELPAAVDNQIAAFDIATPSREQQIGLLSGGNQQKVAMARAALYPARVLVVEEPTQGVDAKARLDIYRELRATAEEGVAIIVKSSDALELAGLCDRVIVLSRGRVLTELRGDELTEERIVGSFLTSAANTAVPAGPTASSAPAAQSRPRRRFPPFASEQTLPLVLLAALMMGVAAYTSARSSDFMTTLNTEHLLINAVPVALIAIAQLNVLLVGGFDLSVGSTITITAVIASFVISNGDPVGAAFAGVAVCIGVGLVVGAANGFMVRGLRLTPVIATIATLSVLQGIALNMRPIAAGLVHDSFIEKANSTLGFLPWAFILVVLLAVAGEFFLYRTAGGLTIRAVGYREEAARRMGVRTSWVHFRAYMLSGLFASLAGLYFVAQIGVGDPNAGTLFTLPSIAAAVLGGASLFGGRGSFVGCVMGALFLSLTTNIIPFLALNSAFGFVASGGLTLAAILLYSSSGRWQRAVARLRTIRGVAAARPPA